MTTACYRCDTSLDFTNKSLEHIIPNAIGGRISSNHLLCRECNSFYGNNFDSEISRQLGFQAHIIDAKTDRPLTDKIVGYTKDGERMGFTPGLKPFNKVTLNIKNEKVDSFLSNSEAQRYVTRKSEEMAKKGKQTTYVQYTRLPGDTVYFKNSQST